MNADELQSKTITCMRFPLIVGIVFIHINITRTRPFCFHGIVYGQNSPEWLYTIYELFGGVFANIAIPLFFIIAGYLFFYNRDYGEFTTQGYVYKLKKRAKTLFIPYLLWNSLFIVAKILTCSSLLRTVAPTSGTLNLTFSSIIHAFYNTKANPIVLYDTPIGINNIVPVDQPMWFIRDLMIVVLCTPIIYWGIRKMKHWFPIILAIGYIVASVCDYSILFLGAICFFSIGAYFSIMDKNIVLEFRKIKYSLILYPLTILVYFCTLQTPILPFMQIVVMTIGIITFVNICSWMVERGWGEVSIRLSGSVFFIFASHTMIIDMIEKLLFMSMNRTDTPLNMLLLYFLTPLLTITI